MKYVKLLFIVCALIWALPTQAADKNVYFNPTTGLQVTKPDSWHFMSAEQNAENLKKIELKDKEFAEAVQKYASVPMLVITKYPEPYEDVNLSFKINMRPLGQLKGMAPKDMLHIMVPQFQKVFADFKLVEAPTDTKVAGLAGAKMLMHYTIEVNGQAYPVASGLWVLPKGDYFYMIGTGLRQDQKNGSIAELESIIQSIKIN